MKNCYQRAKIKFFRSYVLESVAERKGRRKAYFNNQKQRRNQPSKTSFVLLKNNICNVKSDL